MQGIWCIYHDNPLHYLPIFKYKTYIQHHFAFLFSRRNKVFRSQLTNNQALKLQFLLCVLPLLSLFLAHRVAFVYLLDVDIYTSCLAFCCIQSCVQHQNALRLAPKCLAFSGKTQCIQQHITLHFGANGPRLGANCGFMQWKSIFNHAHATPISLHKQPSRELKI